MIVSLTRASHRPGRVDRLVDCPRVSAVAATDAADQKAGFSNWGANWVDVAAPGQDIFSTAPTQPTKLWESTTPATVNYGTISGTSMATPHVAGIAGLVWSTSLCRTNSCVRAQVENAADCIAGTDNSGAWGSMWAKGRVNAARAVSGLISSTKTCL